MPRAGFAEFINAWLSFLDGFIYAVGPRTRFTYRSYTFDSEDGFELNIHVLNASGPTFGDLRSAASAVKDHIEHFAIRLMSYSALEVFIWRLWDVSGIILGVMDVWHLGIGTEHSGLNGMAHGQTASLSNQTAQSSSSSFVPDWGRRINVTSLCSSPQRLDKCSSPATLHKVGTG
ncbi:MAG: hypothetical protein Q9163_005465 [Psora crenata]